MESTTGIPRGSGGEYDAVVVGASIAGCTAATFLGRQGARVAVVESHSDPDSYKVMCTHVFQASCSPTVRRLGIWDTLERAGAQESGVNIWSRYGWVSPSRAYMDRIEEDGVGLNLRRRSLDPILRRMAAETDGVELLTGHTATSLLHEGKRVAGVVVAPRDGAERELRAGLVVGADGRASGVAKMAGGRTKIDRNNRFVYMAYYRDTPLLTGSSPQLWFLDPDMAYAFPTDDDLTMLACVPHKDRIPEFKADPEGAMARMFERAPDGPRLDPDKRVSKILGKLDAPNERRRPAGRGYALVGDAALAADPLWGVGIGWAFQTAEWLAQEVGPALGDDKELDLAVGRYARRHRRELAGHNRACSQYSSGRKFNPVEKLLFRAAARDDELAGRFALFGERWIKPRELLTPSTFGLILRANLGRREAAAKPRAQATAG
jgi:2-polyprenyl-6-methoxyphenol hydroxylase-like FAD-dependent oxidoreductase